MMLLPDSSAVWVTSLSRVDGDVRWTTGDAAVDALLDVSLYPSPPERSPERLADCASRRTVKENDDVTG